jgi:hypothetical protein
VRHLLRQLPIMYDKPKARSNAKTPSIGVGANRGKGMHDVLHLSLCSTNYI